LLITLFQSLFGKNLITILNEYVAVKAKGEFPPKKMKRFGIHNESFPIITCLCHFFCRINSRKSNPRSDDIIMEKA